VVEYNAQVTEGVVNSDRAASELKQTVHTCDFPDCNYAAKKAEALAMHKRKVHTSKTTLKRDSVDHDTQNTKQETTVYSCDFAGCSYTSRRRQDVSLHRYRKHSQTYNKVCRNTSSRHSANLPHLNDTEFMSLQAPNTESQVTSICAPTAEDYGVNSAASPSTSNYSSRKGVKRKCY